MAYPATGLFAGQVWDCEEIEEDTETSRIGAAFQINATGAGTVTLTLGSGATNVQIVQEGTTIVPYQVKKATVGTATISQYYSLFPTLG